MKSRRKFTAVFKAKVALEAIKECESIRTLSSKYELSSRSLKIHLYPERRTTEELPPTDEPTIAEKQIFTPLKTKDISRFQREQKKEAKTARQRRRRKKKTPKNKK